MSTAISSMVSLASCSNKFCLHINLQATYFIPPLSLKAEVSRRATENSYSQPYELNSWKGVNLESL